MTGLYEILSSWDNQSQSLYSVSGILNRSILPLYLQITMLLVAIIFQMLKYLENAMLSDYGKSNSGSKESGIHDDRCQSVFFTPPPPPTHTDSIKPDNEQEDHRRC